jgi:diadenosine tetraphosphatase ApaH/serine/threonine PP2A family protein phosphatase
LFSGDVAEANLAAFDTPYCLVGHTHVPLVFRERRGRIEALAVDPGSRLQFDERRLILNPGSVGQPRDGDPTASYLILDTAAGHATWQRVAYDIEATQARMLAVRLPPRLSRRLRYGQ